MIMALGLISAQAAPSAARDAVSYEVTPVVGPGGLDGVDITLSFQGDRDGRTEVHLPSGWAGALRLDRTFADVRVEGARLQRRRSGLRLRHWGGAPIRLTYRVRQDYAGPPRVGFDRPYRPSTLRNGFTLIGRTIFAHVEGRDHDPVRFRWSDPAPAWRYASDLDPLAGTPIDFDTLADSVLIGGPGLTLLTRASSAGPVRIAILGSWGFSPDALADRFVGIGEASADFWGDDGQPTFLALTPLAGDPSARVQSGLGLGDGVAVWLTPNQTLDEVSHVLIHEQQHAWLPARVGGLADGPSQVLDFWFSEGFTDFYAYRMALRLDLITPEAYVAALDEALALQARAPPGWGNSGVARSFFLRPGAAAVPYHRGLLLALSLDGRLRAASGGERDLDDVILAMRGGRGTAPQRLIQAYGDLGGGDIAPDLHRHLDLGRPIAVSTEGLGDCIRVITGPDRLYLEPGPGLTGEDTQGCRQQLSGRQAYKDILI
jgi:predicted metalloprotease with PDZ domain